MYTLLDKNSLDKIVEISAWRRKFCPTEILSDKVFYKLAHMILEINTYLISLF